MIRLNDSNKIVIDETKINEYYSQDEMGLPVIKMIICGNYENILYSTKEARDKDIELLDKIFDVKDIEYKAIAESKPSYDFGEPQVLEPEPTKKEKYLTWKEAKKYATMIKAKLPNGEIALISWNDCCIYMYDEVNREYRINATIYDEDLFNALMLKKVE